MRREVHGVHVEQRADRVRPVGDRAHRRDGADQVRRPGQRDETGPLVDGRRERTEVESRLAVLTSGELELLRSLYVGHTVAEIAAGRRVSEVVVRTRVRTVLAKLDLGSQLAAVTRLSRLLVLETDSGRSA